MFNKVICIWFLLLNIAHAQVIVEGAPATGVRLSDLSRMHGVRLGVLFFDGDYDEGKISLQYLIDPSRGNFSANTQLSAMYNLTEMRLADDTLIFGGVFIALNENDNLIENLQKTLGAGFSLELSMPLDKWGSFRVFAKADWDMASTINRSNNARDTNIEIEKILTPEELDMILSELNSSPVKQDLLDYYQDEQRKVNNSFLVIGVNWVFNR